MTLSRQDTSIGFPPELESFRQLILSLDDKQWAASDNNPASPYNGHVYVVWDDLNAGTCAFARRIRMPLRKSG